MQIITLTLDASTTLIASEPAARAAITTHGLAPRDRIQIALPDGEILGTWHVAGRLDGSDVHLGVGYYTDGDRGGIWSTDMQARTVDRD